MKALLCALGALAPLFASPAVAQDLYDPATVRTIDLTFQDPNFLSLLRQNFTSQTMIQADLTMEGITYPGVGVRIRGNTSYFWLPTGSEKYSLAIAMDFTNPGQDLLGYNSLNLNNGHQDPTFCREVIFNNHIARYIPNTRANHVLVTLNGQNWGVYINLQQFNKDMLRDYFDDPGGMRVKCSNNPNGPALLYVGSSQAQYPDYDIKHDGGLPNPWVRLIECFYTVTFTPLSVYERADGVLALDTSIWMVVLENLFTDKDGYANEGSDFSMYRNPVDGRFHLIQSDGNETFSAPYWAIDHNFGNGNRPLLSRLLSVPQLRARYMAHMRTALEEFDWGDQLGVFRDARNRIDAHVAADPKKVYTHQMFQDNFTNTVYLGGGPGGGNLIGIRTFVEQRAAHLRSHSEIQSPAPDILWTTHEPAVPDPQDTVYVTARVEANVDPVNGVDLYYLANPGTYLRIPMLDDGLNADFAPGDGIYGVRLPITARGGQEVRYYVAATASNSFGSMSFLPTHTELKPSLVQYQFGYTGMRITEYLYSATDGEFVELTNTSSTPVDMNGWSMDDGSNQPGTFDISAAGVVAPGQSIVITDAIPSAFQNAWGLTGVAIVGPTAGADLGRNDVINIYNAGGDLVERLAYGDEQFPGSVRAKDRSGQACSQALGSNNPFGLSLASAGDPFASYTSAGGDLGSPGLFQGVDCALLGTEYCNPAAVNSTGNSASISAFGSGFAEANRLTLLVKDLPTGEFSFFLNGTASGFSPGASGSAGNLCLDGAIGRYNRVGQLFASDAQGKGSLAINLGGMPTPLGPQPALAGQTWYFQCWYRDTPANTSNFTSALSVQFQ